MKKIVSKFGQYILTIVFTIAIFSIFSIAALAAIPNAGTLYEKWIQEIFVSPPSGDSGLTDALTNPTVKRAHALTDQNGTEVAWGIKDPNGGQGKFLIGDSSISDETLKIEGENAVLKISATNGNPEISFGETNGNHGAIYFNTPNNTLTLWNQYNALQINESGIEFPNGATAQGKRIVPIFTCNDGTLLKGFDADANPICSNKIASQYIWVSHPTANCSVSCGGGTIPYTVKCRDSEDNYAEVADSLCIIEDKPSTVSRLCNEFACS